MRVKQVGRHLAAEQSESAPYAAPAPKPAETSAVSYAPPKVEIKMVLYSYTAENVINGTVLDTRTDLGALDSGLFTRLHNALIDLNDFAVPADLPSWKLDLVNAGIKQGGSFTLHMEIYVGDAAPTDITIIGTQQFHDLLPYL